jgi:ubiquitin C-terminal hydrolase
MNLYKIHHDLACRCDACKQLVAAEKGMVVWDAPNLLVIHLKRFDGLWGKVGRPISFPDLLDLTPFMSVERQQQQQQQQHSAAVGACSRGPVGGYAAGHTSGAAHTSAAGHTSAAQPSASFLGHSGPSRYVLHGVLVHEGSTASSGHYYAYVRDGMPGSSSGWHCMNDSSVHQVSREEVSSGAGGCEV